MKKILYLFIILIASSLYANGQIKESTSKYHGDTTVFRGPYYVNFRNTSVAEYLERLKKPSTEEISVANNLLSLVNSASATWIRREELAYLITLINSEEPAKCVVTTFASTLPLKDTATIGGHALDLIDAYRLEKEYPSSLANCPKIDPTRKEKIKKWWETYNK